MDPKLQQQLAEYLKEFVGAVKAGGEFALQQAPLVVQEKIAYGRASTAITLLMSIAILGAVARSAPAVGRLITAADRDGDAAKMAGAVIATVVMLVAGFVSAIVFFGTYEDALKVWFAPRLYILEWVASLVK